MGTRGTWSGKSSGKAPILSTRQHDGITPGSRGEPPPFHPTRLGIILRSHQLDRAPAQRHPDHRRRGLSEEPGPLRNQADHPVVIPRIIHQTWKDRNVPRRFREAQASWRRHHPEWEYRFWTDQDLDRLIRERAPELAAQYRRYPENIQRVDAARYVILREYGGLYADLDTHCLRPMDELLSNPLVLPLTTPFGVSNQLMLAEPSHPLFHHAVDSLPAAFRWRRFIWPRHLRILTTTGPLFLTGCLRAYGPVKGLRLLSLAEHGHGDPEHSFVRHLRGNTWAHWDTYVINFFHDNWRVLVGAGAGLLLLVLALWSVMS